MDRKHLVSIRYFPTALALVIGGVSLALPPAWSQAQEDDPKSRSHTVMNTRWIA